MATEASPAQLESRRALEGGSSGWFPCFDGLRAIAAMSVFAFHTVSATARPGWAPTLVQDWVARFGGFGVAVFFVISGFLLYRPFVLAHFQGRPGPRLGSFWFRRCARIFPGYWLALTATFFVILPATRPRSVPDFATFYGLVQNYRTGYLLQGITVAWTLVIELSFYIALPGIAWCLRALCRSDAPPRARLRAQVIGLVAITAAATALRIWQLWIAPPPTFHFGAWFEIGHIGNWLPGYLDWFAMGMLLAVVSAWIAVGGGIPRALAVLGRRPWLSWLLALEAYWALTRLRLPRVTRALTPFSPLQGFLAAELLLVCAVFLIAPAVLGHQGRGAIRGVLRSAPLVGLGIISYGIYLWHVPMWIASTSWHADGWLPASRLLQTVIILAMTLGAATLSFLLVERPARLWAQRVTRRTPQSVATDPPAPVAWPATAPEVAEPPERGVHASTILVPLAVLLLVVAFALPPRFRSLPSAAGPASLTHSVVAVAAR